MVYAEVNNPALNLLRSRLGRRTGPVAGLISGCDPDRYRAECGGGSRCMLLAGARAASRSRGSSSMRGRRVAKSPAARGRLTFTSHRLDRVLVAPHTCGPARDERKLVNFPKQGVA